MDKEPIQLHNSSIVVTFMIICLILTGKYLIPMVIALEETFKKEKNMEMAHMNGQMGPDTKALISMMQNMVRGSLNPALKMLIGKVNGIMEKDKVQECYRLLKKSIWECGAMES